MSAQIPTSLRDCSSLNDLNTYLDNADLKVTKFGGRRIQQKNSNESVSVNDVVKKFKELKGQDPELASRVAHKISTLDQKLTKKVARENVVVKTMSKIRNLAADKAKPLYDVNQGLDRDKILTKSMLKEVSKALDRINNSTTPDIKDYITLVARYGEVFNLKGSSFDGKFSEFLDDNYPTLQKSMQENELRENLKSAVNKINTDRRLKADNATGDEKLLKLLLFSPRILNFNDALFVYKQWGFDKEISPQDVSKMGVKEAFNRIYGDLGKFVVEHEEEQKYVGELDSALTRLYNLNRGAKFDDEYLDKGVFEDMLLYVGRYGFHHRPLTEEGWKFDNTYDFTNIYMINNVETGVISACRDLENEGNERLLYLLNQLQTRKLNEKEAQFVIKEWHLNEPVRPQELYKLQVQKTLIDENASKKL